MSANPPSKPARRHPCCPASLAALSLWLSVHAAQAVATGAHNGTTDEDGIEEMVVRTRADGVAGVLQSSRRASVPAASFTDLLQSTPTVALVGQGGRLQTFSIRGLSKERIRVLFQDAPIRALRRAGVSAAFLNPDWMTVTTQPVTVSTEHGSGTTGGVVHVAPQRETSSRIDLTYEGSGDRQALNAVASRGAFLGALGYSTMSDQQAADGTRLNSSFEQVSALVEHTLARDALEARTTLLLSDAHDVGKSNADFPERITNYPKDRHLFVSHRQTNPLGTFTAWAHRQALDTKVARDDTRTDVEASVTDLGLRYQRLAVESAEGSLTFGLDAFGRTGYDVEEDSITTLDDGSELELGAYVTGERRWQRWRLGLGGRLLHARADAAEASRFDTTELLGHAQLGWQPSRQLATTLTVSRSATAPTVSQLFFTGTTGRGGIVGNEALDAEDAWVYEWSAALTRGSYTFELGAFFMDIDSFIEKVPITSAVDTFVNASGGEIYGFTGKFEYRAGQLSVATAVNTLRSALDEGGAIRDIPNNQATASVRYATGFGTATLEVAQRFKADRVADGDREADARTLVNAGFEWRPHERWRVEVFGRNLLDELYYTSNDSKASLGPERSFGVQLSADI